MKNQKTPPIPKAMGQMPPNKKRKTKTIIIIVVLAVIFLPGFIAMLVNDGSKSISDIERLQRDSIALQGNFMPKHEYTDVHEIILAVDSIYDLGRPTRFIGDSAKINNDPRLKALADYNTSKCDSVLASVLPTWRKVATYAIQVEEGTRRARLQVVGDDYTQINFTSPRFIDDEESKDMYLRYSAFFKLLGFRKAVFQLAPNHEVISFEVK